MEPVSLIDKKRWQRMIEVGEVAGPVSEAAMLSRARRRGGGTAQ